MHNDKERFCRYCVFQKWKLITTRYGVRTPPKKHNMNLYRYDNCKLQTAKCGK